MENNFVRYEQALALKELKFDEPCFGYYFGKDKEVYLLDGQMSAPFEPSLDSKVMFRAPLKQQAFKWFRDKYNLIVTIQTLMKDNWLLTIQFTDSTTTNGVYNGKRWELDNDEGYIEPKSYEEAEDACLDKLIEIVKTK